jgi:hypothetical protein
MSTAHTFDYITNWLLFPSPNGMPSNAAFHPTVEARGLSDGFFWKKGVKKEADRSVSFLTQDPVFLGGLFLQHRLAGKIDPSLIIDFGHLDENGIADIDDIGHLGDPGQIQLGDVH